MSLDAVLVPLVNITAPELLARHGVGPHMAGALLVAAGDNPGRLRNERTFAHLCGVSRLDASSGEQQRHRLNRSVDRQANAALWRIVDPPLLRPRHPELVRAAHQEGLSKLEAMRCLIGRYAAREVFYLLPKEVA